MTNPEKTFNAGYEIIQRIDLGDRHFVVGHNPKAPSSHVTWQYIPEKNYYYQGHYFGDEKEATLDMFRRASERLEFEGKSLAVALLSDSDRQDLFLEFQNDLARDDIAQALNAEMDFQEERYDQEALLADPDFLSRAMYHYNNLDHSADNEVLRDELAMLLDDYPQYKLPALVPQQATIQMFPEMHTLVKNLLTLPSAEIPKKYGPLGDNLSFEIPLENDCTACVEVVPSYELMNPHALSKTEAHFLFVMIQDASGKVIEEESTYGKDLSKFFSGKDCEIKLEYTKLTLNLREEESLRRTGNSFVFRATSEDERYTQHNGEVCTIQKALTAKECDMLCTGFMWVAEFPNGDQLHVFDDELTALSQEKDLKAPLHQQIQNAQQKAVESAAGLEERNQER